MNMCACRTACRFPLAPLSHQYIPNEYCVNTCGHPCYHVPPHFGGQYYVFHRNCNCHTHNCCGMTYAPCGNRWHQLGIPRYHALHEPLSIPMGYQCYFPACDQLEVGKYRLIIEVEVFEQGYGRNNIHTYTIDKGIVFTLVCGGSGMSGNISINLLGNEYVGFSTAASANRQKVTICGYVLRNLSQMLLRLGLKFHQKKQKRRRVIIAIVAVMLCKLRRLIC